jgi:hypothetical protein
MPPSKTSKSAKATEPTTKQMDARGSSDDWQKGQEAQVKIGNELLAHVKEADSELSAKWGLEWTTVPEEEMMDEAIWGHLATFLVETRVIPAGNRNAGKKYDVGSAHGCWGGLLNQAGVRFSKSTRKETQVCCPCGRTRGRTRTHAALVVANSLPSAYAGLLP